MEQNKIEITGNLPYYNPATFISKDEPVTKEFPIVTSSIRFADWSEKEDDGKMKEGNIILLNSELEKLISCGFNVLIKTIGNAYIDANFANIGDKNLSLLIRNNIFFEYDDPKYSNGLGFIKDHILNQSRFAGIYATDEPSYLDLIEGSDLYNHYHKELTYIGEHIIYINLLGPWDGEKTFTNGQTSRSVTYDEYINKFQENFAPAFWPYDIYPIRENLVLLNPNVNNNGEIRVGYDIFYKAFDYFYKLSKKTGRPFWAFCQSMSYFNANANLFRPIALEQYLRFEAFTALAHGAQGIEYWCYGTRQNRNSEIYFSALLDRQNVKTASWYYAQKINAEIQKYSNVFLGCQVEDMVHSDVIEGRENDHRIRDFGIFSEIQSTGGNGFLVSKIWNRLEYYVIVSKDVLQYQKLTITVKPTSYNIGQLTPKRSGEKPPASFQPLEQSVTLNQILTPGGYIIFRCAPNEIPLP